MECLAAPQVMSEMADHVAAVQDFESIARQFRPKVFRFLLASTRDRDIADNLTQECLLRAYQAYGRFRGDCKPDSWLLQIALNLLRDHGRNRRFQFWKRTRTHGIQARDMQEILADKGPSPEADLLKSERLQRVWSAVDLLSERQRSVFLLRFVEDMEVLEIAAVTGLKEGTVKAHLFRAVQSVKDSLGVYE